MRNLFCLSPSNQTLLWQQIGRNMFPSSARTALKASILFNERERPPCAASPPPEGDHEKNGDAAEDIFPFFRRGSPFQPLLSSLTLDAYSGSETDPSEAFSGRRPRREDTGPSGGVPPKKGRKSWPLSCENPRVLLPASSPYQFQRELGRNGETLCTFPKRTK